MALISLEHVSKVYPKGTRPALDDINLDIDRGDFVFLVGASGSGKTTLLSLLLREEEATDGEIRVAGNDLRRLSARQVPHYRRQIGFIFQDYKLLNNKTVWENVAFALEVIGTRRSTIKSLVPKVLDTVGLTGKEKNYPHELSGGEQQRVAIARAYVNHPQILLADEPTGNLDPTTSLGIMEVLDAINRTGTTIKWRPDLEVFTSISIPHDWYRETMRRQAVVNANVTFRLRIEGDDGEFTEEDFCYPKGIEDYVLEKVGTDYLTEPFFIEADRRGRDREDLPDYNVKITACMCFSRTFMMQEYYHNSSWLENGGSPEKAARSALTSAIDAYIKQQGKYNKNESGIKWQDVQDCLVLVTNCFSTQTSYENQTKKAINNRFIQQAMTAFFKERLSTYLIENKDAANKIMEQVLINKRSRENAEKTRQSIKTNLQQKTDMANRVQKFIDCRSKDKSRREIYIVEGDSAAGAIRTSRDAEFQGVMPVRGKILNCLKEDYPRIFKSDIIMDLMRVLGCGVEIKDKRIKNLGAFDLDNLNWNKVIICTDADVDGYHIRTLVLTMLYRLVPTLIDEGYVYIAESPLYEINCKEKTYFAYTELEKNGILKEIGDQKCSINRSKGLGENDPDMMWLTTMNPETRRLIKVEPEDVTKMETMFNLLLGNDEAGRKRHISEHGKEYLDQLDLQ